MNQIAKINKPEEAKLLVAVAEASAWIALLHGPRRTPAAERGFQHWLKESAVHRKAFEHATDTWNQTRGNVRQAARVDIDVPGERTQRREQSSRRPAMFAAAAAVLVAVIGAAFYFQRPGITTGVGERRTVILDDGTQVSLNTATKLLVLYGEHERRVELQSGEALFEVARQTDRPFVVVAGDREVTALGTAFLVRRDDRQLAVTLVEGKIAVSSVPTSNPQILDAGTVMLTPGQRLVLAEHKRPVLDRPVLEKLTAWQQGLVNIDNLTLAEAVAEMNRYSSLQLEVEGPAASIRVSGVFRLTDSENLAKAVARTHGLELRQAGRRIVLYGNPQPPSESRFGPGTSQAQ